VRVSATVGRVGGKKKRSAHLSKSRTVRIGRHGRRTVALRLVKAGRAPLRAALALCRVAKVRVRATAHGFRASATRTLSTPTSCHKIPAGIQRPPGSGNGKPARFQVGAASIDFAPPLHGKAPGGDPADCPAPGFDGLRPFAYMEPYQDINHVKPPSPTDVPPKPPERVDVNEHYDDGEPYVDCNGNGRWDGNFIGGGGGGTRYAVKEADPTTARAVVVSNGSRTIGVEVVDQEGLFNVYQDQIRQRVIADLGGAAKSPLKDSDMFLSATHDESAQQSLGLNGANDTTSATNDYWLNQEFIPDSAKAIEQAYAARKPATIRYAEAQEPADMRQCWSSYPFVDDMRMPTLQAVGDDGRAIATLTDVSQHTETLGFNSDPAERLWYTADWPHFFRTSLEQRYGGVAIEMAGSVGSVESPEVFGGPLSLIPQKYIDESHPAGCRTLFDAGGAAHVPLGYTRETQAYGEQLATAVAGALDTGSSPSVSGTLSGARADICVPVTNQMFAIGGAAGVFAHRPSYNSDCSAAVPPGPTGSTAGTNVKSQVAVFRIGDGTFASVPGEVFPFTYLRSFLGPQDMPYPGDPIPQWLIPHMHTQFRFINGLGEDMIGYIFPPASGVGVPGERGTNATDYSKDDRFGCHHSDDDEAASSSTSMIAGDALVKLLDAGGAKPERIAKGRYVLPDGTASRDPLGGPEPKCNVDKTFKPNGPAPAIELEGGQIVHPAAWMSLHGRPQSVPDRNTRGYFEGDGTRVWLDVYPDVQIP
jgi:hypothetical protein